MLQRSITGGSFFESKKSSEMVRKERTTEFEDTILLIYQLHNRPSISFQECIQYFSRFDIRFSSPVEFKKFSKMLARPISKCLPTHKILESLVLEASQKVGQCSSYLVKVNSKLVKNNDSGYRFEFDHQISECMKPFFHEMKRLYGKEINWFRAIGGLTIGVSIPHALFSDRVKNIVSKTKHKDCVTRVIEQFIEDKRTPVTWNRFRDVVNKYQKVFEQDSKVRKEHQHFYSNQRPRTTSATYSRPKKCDPKVSHKSFTEACDVPQTETRGVYEYYSLGIRSFLKAKPTKFDACKTVYSEFQVKSRPSIIRRNQRGYQRKNWKSISDMEVLGYQTGSFQR